MLQIIEAFENVQCNRPSMAIDINRCQSNGIEATLWSPELH